MAVEISINYTGELHCDAQHGPSGATLSTDAPVDNHGKGQSFSPTDLVATAYGTCMATLMGIVSQKHQIELKGMKIKVIKEMSQDTPRRISRLDITFQIPTVVPVDKRQLLENAATTCPVHHSISKEIERSVVFQWAEA